MFLYLLGSFYFVLHYSDEVLDNNQHLFNNHHYDELLEANSLLCKSEFALPLFYLV